MRLVCPRVVPGSAGVYLPVFPPLRARGGTGYWPPGGQNPTSTRMAPAGPSRCSTMALLLCSKRTLALLPLLQLSAAHSNFCSHIRIFQSAADSWTAGPRCQGGRPLEHSVFLVGPGSSYIWFPLPQSLHSFLCTGPTFFSLHRCQLYLGDFTHY